MHSANSFAVGSRFSTRAARSGVKNRTRVSGCQGAILSITRLSIWRSRVNCSKTPSEAVVVTKATWSSSEIDVAINFLSSCFRRNRLENERFTVSTKITTERAPPLLLVEGAVDGEFFTASLAVGEAGRDNLSVRSKEKKLIFCGRSFSKTSKSSFLRFSTILPFLSVTTARTFTSSVLSFKTGSWSFFTSCAKSRIASRSRVDNRKSRQITDARLVFVIRASFLQLKSFPLTYTAG